MIKSRKIREAEHVAHTVLMGRPEGKRPLKNPKRRWEDNIKGKAWTQNRNRQPALVTAVMNRWIA